MPLVPPRIINFGMTHRCNFSCPICNTKQEITDKEGELSLKEIKENIQDIAEWNDLSDSEKIKISFAGGEPLVRKKDTIAAIELASTLDLETHLTTNGSLIGRQTSRELIDSGLSSVSVSLDGSNSQINNQLRGEGSFEPALAGLKNLIAAKEEANAEVTIGTVTVITRQNLTDLPRIYQFAKKLGADEVNFNPYAIDNSFMDKGDYDKDPFWIPEEELGTLKKITEKIKSLKRKEQDIRTPQQVLANLKSYFQLKGDFRKGKCLAGHSYMYIKPNGEVDVCGKGPSFDWRPMNVKERNIRSIWRSFNFFVTRLKIKRCQRPCLMLCFEKTEKGLSQRLKAFLSLHRERG